MMKNCDSKQSTRLVKLADFRGRLKDFLNPSPQQSVFQRYSLSALIVHLGLNYDSFLRLYYDRPQYRSAIISCLTQMACDIEIAVMEGKVKSEYLKTWNQNYGPLLAYTKGMKIPKIDMLEIEKS